MSSSLDFLDKPWAIWLTAFLVALAVPDLLVIWVVCFAGYFGWKLLRWLGRSAQDELAAMRQRSQQRGRERQWHRSQRQWDQERRRQRPIEEARERKERADQRRRQEARAQVEMFYSLHAPEIGERFSRSMFDDFVRRHLGDDHEPDHVDERAKQLLAMLRQHLAKVQAPNAEESLEAILASFAERKKRIEATALDPREKELLTLQLDELRDEAIRRAVREGR